VLLLLIFGNIIASPSLSLADTVTMHNLGGDKHRYGVQRLWGSLGFGVAAFGIGALVSARGYCMGDSGDSQTVDVDYTPCFYSFAAFLSCALITSFKFNFPNDTCPKGKTSDRLYTVRSLLRGRFLMFLLVAFHFGFMIAFTKTFLFWHLKELGGTQLLFCIITAVNCIAEVTMYFLSAKLLTFITHTRVLYMGFLCYAIRAFAYYLITSPWMVLTVEILSGITSAASWAAMLAFVSENSTPGYTATFQGVIHAIHWGLGCGAGEMVGGYMVDALGTGGSFCVLGVLSLGFYFFFFSAWGSLLPYLALYFKQLMLSPSEVGILMGLKPFVNFLVIPIWGAIVDKCHKSKLVLVISMIALITTTFSLSLVPAPKEKKFDTTPAFITLFLITFFGTLFSSPTLALVDTATIQLLGKETYKYGMQRLTGSIGWGIGAFVVGASLKTTHKCSNDISYEIVDYIPCFYTFAVLMFLGLVVATRYKFDESAQTSHGGSLRVGLRALKNPKYIMFLFTALYLGFLMAFIKTFLFWHLKDLGGTQLLFSIISAVNCFAEVSMYFLSAKLIKKIGHAKVLYLGLICYSIRLFYYSAIPIPWLVLVVELLPGITTAAVWAACLSYVSLNSGPGAATTMQCILHGVHWGLGYGAGEVIGGVMVHHYGAPFTFVFFGCFCIIVLAMY
ncbi:predicted protein, partial [Nematostella vectensis]